MAFSEEVSGLQSIAGNSKTESVFTNNTLRYFAATEAWPSKSLLFLSTAKIKLTRGLQTTNYGITLAKTQIGCNENEFHFPSRSQLILTCYQTVFFFPHVFASLISKWTVSVSALPWLCISLVLFPPFYISIVTSHFQTFILCHMQWPTL